MADIQPEIVTDKSEPGKIGIRQAGSPDTHWLDESEFRARLERETKPQITREALVKELAARVVDAKVDPKTASVAALKTAAETPVKTDAIKAVK